MVLGASLAALTAASGLSEAFREVILVDRDEVIDVREARRGVPHGRHVHGLLAQGARVMEDLFPEITAEMVAAGCPLTDLAGTVRWYFQGKRLQQARSGLINVAARRPVLEYHVRRRVQALENVRFLQRHDVTGLVFSDDGNRVLGARVQPSEGGAEETILADLVIDATGRGSRMPVWLQEQGYPRVPEEGTKIDLGYATRHYKTLRTDVFGTDHSILPCGPRGAFFTKTDSGLFELTIYGTLGDHPPTDPEGYNAFAKTLDAPEIYEAVADAEPLDDAVLFRFPKTGRRRYELLPRIPDRLLMLGDSIASFNPLYGQGMTLALLEAHALREELRKGRIPDSTQFMKKLARIVDPVWKMAEGTNLADPRVEGERPRALKLMLGYMAKVQQAAAKDPAVTKAFMSAAALVEPNALMRPGTILRVLRHTTPVPPVLAQLSRLPKLVGALRG